MSSEYALGEAAARAGEPNSACPWSPSTAEGKAWHKGWFNAERARRNTSGQASADTQRMKAEAKALAASWEPSRYAPNPVDALLAEVADEPKPSVSYGISLTEMSDALAAIGKTLSEVFTNAVNAIAPVFDRLMAVVDEAEQNRPASVNRKRHGYAAICPRHGETRGGTCMRCARR